MTKETKLTEKAVRMPETREAKWEEAISKYLHVVEPLNSETARSMRFSMFVQELLGLQIGFVESYVSGIEKYIKTKGKDRILRGKADNLFGNVIIEFETSIAKKRQEAEEQLQRYVAILWSQEMPDARTPYLCIATDGVRFITYTPTITDPTAKNVEPTEVRLRVLEEADWTKLKPEDVFYWLDRYFLRKEVLHPTSEMMVHDFGVKSHAFETTASSLLALWQRIKAKSDFSVIYGGWEKYLRIVYGSEVAGSELFIRHTYLATLAKLMSWKRLTESTSLPREAQIVELLEGKLFKSQGIENFIEEDFFSWLARENAVKTGVGISRWLFSLLQNYNLRELSEDVLKSLYQELVDPDTRHDLGEFYTPDWLAHRIVRKLLDINSQGSMFDPACGSGTFLYLAIKEKRERLGDSLDTLHHILTSVYGADIHPLAVIVAKTNYILALGDLLKKRKGQVAIPIYLADTLRLPNLVLQGRTPIVSDSLVPQLPGYELELNGCKVQLPEQLIRDAPLYDKAIELMKEFARQNKGKPIALEAFRNFLEAQHFPLKNESLIIQALFAITQVLKQFIDSDRDTIWAFVLKNSYKPLFLKQKFDFVMGNPPWIAFRYMEPGYQTWLKRQITVEYGLLRGRGELITHLEIATLFLVRAADLYLKMGGTIAFVLPKSLFSADQHHGLRERSFKFSEYSVENLFYGEIWDCENVTPLFNVPACVLIADKREIAKMKYPIAGQILDGHLKHKNASLAEAERDLSIEGVQFSLHTRGKRSYWATGKETTRKKASYYKDKFAQGATIVPRSFWFVRVKPSPLGFDASLPPLETDPRAIEKAKAPYKDIRFEGNMESRFLYATLLSTDLLPFGHLGYRLVVLPIEPVEGRYKLIDADEAHKKGFIHLGRWLERAQAEWEKRRGSKAKRMDVFQRLNRYRGLTSQNQQAIDWLDYRQKLTRQEQRTEYRVLYNTSGTFLTAVTVKNESIEFEVNGQTIVVNGFLAESVSYFFEAPKLDEANYLSAILNAPRIDDLIKPMQARGLWGPRHIHKKVLELPIPQFNATNPAHCRLAELGKECSAKVEQWVAGGGAGNIKSIGKLRSMVREMLKAELAEIDSLVKEILI